MTKRITSRHLHPPVVYPCSTGDGLIEAEVAAFDKFWHCRFVTPCTQAIGVGAPPDWAEERFPLYVYYLSGHLPPAKVRAFIDFVESSVLPIGHGRS
jgi:hypothetical protein